MELTRTWARQLSGVSLVVLVVPAAILAALAALLFAGGTVRAIADSAVKAAGSVTSRIPGPVGPAAAGVVHSVGGTVDGILSSPVLSGSAGPGHGLP
jgi:hypothetical protein